MSKNSVQFYGKIESICGGGRFIVSLKSSVESNIPVKRNAKISASIAGRMQHHKIKIVVGDTVRVAITADNLSHGIIVFREKESRL